MKNEQKNLVQFTKEQKTGKIYVRKNKAYKKLPKIEEYIFKMSVKNCSKKVKKKRKSTKNLPKFTKKLWKRNKICSDREKITKKWKKMN